MTKKREAKEKGILYFANGYTLELVSSYEGILYDYIMRSLWKDADRDCYISKEWINLYVKDSDSYRGFEDTDIDVEIILVGPNSERRPIEDIYIQSHNILFHIWDYD